MDSGCLVIAIYAMMLAAALFVFWATLWFLTTPVGIGIAVFSTLVAAVWFIANFIKGYLSRP